MTNLNNFFFSGNWGFFLIGAGVEKAAALIKNEYAQKYFARKSIDSQSMEYVENPPRNLRRQAEMNQVSSQNTIVISPLDS